MQPQMYWYDGRHATKSKAFLLRKTCCHHTHTFGVAVSHNRVASCIRAFKAMEKTIHLVSYLYWEEYQGTVETPEIKTDG